MTMMQPVMSDIPPAGGWDPVLMNRRAAFDVFDVAHDGTINSFELTMALMGCDDVRAAVQGINSRQLRDAEIQSAVDRVDIEPGTLITFSDFLKVCEILIHNLAAKQADEEARYEQNILMLEDEVNRARAGSPQSPREETALISCPILHPELGVVQKAFYAFDIDRSGSVSGHEIPRMLQLVGIGPKTKNHDAWATFEKKWHKALRSIYPPKEPNELLNVFDFHDMCMILNPKLVRELPERPPPPPPPVESLSLDELNRMEREEQARRAEEERIRKEEEERIAKSTLHVKAPGGQVFCLLETNTSDSVAMIMKRIEDIEGVPVSQQRLVAQGFEMSPKQTLSDYGVKIGHPQRHKAHTITLLLRAPPAGDIIPARKLVGDLYIKTSVGDIITISAKADDSVGEVMRKVSEITGIPAIRQRIIGNGRYATRHLSHYTCFFILYNTNYQYRELPNFERLREGGVYPGDTVSLLIR